MKVDLGSPRRPRIEMLPLIDTVFLLLVFFIYGMLSMAVHHSLPVKLPSSTTAKLDKSEFVTVTIKSDGSVFVNKKPVSEEALSRVIENYGTPGKSSGVLLFADRTVSYQTLFRVLDRIREAGVERISLQAELAQR
ncbi:MAG: biopolymer transporter ExbD [Deltaproteobacteria bacterium]|nr:MAG: biopolymer transporter ExbD [Deltaproteobacteria bacterium]